MKLFVALAALFSANISSAADTCLFSKNETKVAQVISASLGKTCTLAQDQYGLKVARCNGVNLNLVVGANEKEFFIHTETTDAFPEFRECWVRGQLKKSFWGSCSVDLKQEVCEIVTALQ